MNMLKGILPRFGAVQQVSPCLPDVRLSNVHRPAMQRFGNIGPKRIAERRQPEAAIRFLIEYADTCQGTQQAIEGAGVGFGDGGKVVVRAGAIPEEIGDAENGSDMEHLRNLVAIH